MHPNLEVKFDLFIRGQWSASDLWNWLLPQLSHFLSTGNADDGAAVCAVELGVIEIDEGLITENELRTRLSEFVAPYLTEASNYTLAVKVKWSG